MFGNKNKEEEERFVEIYRSRVSNVFMSVMVDTKSGVSYGIIEKPEGISMTPLIDSNGKPMIEPVE